MHNRFHIGLVSPSGGGKTTLVKHLVSEYGFFPVKSHTTRPPRYIGEEEYIFNSLEEFEQLITQGYFIEYEYLFGNYYGTPKEYFNYDKNLVFSVDIKGISKIKSLLPIYVILVLPPSLEVLKARLGSRDKSCCKQRIERAKEELTYIPDFFLINEEIEYTKEQLNHIVKLLDYQVGCQIKQKTLIV